MSIGERRLGYHSSTIRPTESIVVTGYQDYVRSRALISVSRCREVIQKGEMTTDDLAAALATARQDKWPYVELEPADLISIVAEQLSQPAQAIAPGEVHDLLMRVFGREPLVRLKPITNVWRSDGNRAGVRRRSVVLWAEPAGKNPSVVKLALSHRAAREEQNYHSHVHHKLGGDYYLNMEAVDYLWHLGATVYRAHGMGDKSVTFTEHYDGQDAQAIVRPLAHFFSRIWLGHYRACRPLAHESLLESYDELWRSETTAIGGLSLALEQHVGLRPPEVVADLLENARQPFQWLAAAANGAAHPVFVGLKSGDLRQCVVHGDLHGDNLLVDNNMHVWPIDYERTGFGHVLTDFVELEHDIMTRLTNGDDLQRLLYVRAYVACTPHLGNRGLSQMERS